MKETKSAKSLFEMNCEEAKRIIEKKGNDKDSLVSQFKFGRLAKHCLNCDKCRAKATKVGLLVASES